MVARVPYSEKNDKKADTPLIKGLTAAQRREFKRLDEKHCKVKWQDEDTAIDRKIIKKVKRKFTSVKKSK